MFEFSCVDNMSNIFAFMVKMVYGNIYSYIHAIFFKFYM